MSGRKRRKHTGKERLSAAKGYMKEKEDKRKRERMARREGKGTGKRERGEG